MGLRISLGGSVGRLARLIGTESLLLATMGGLVGIALGRWGLHTLLRSLPETPPRWTNFEMDWRVWLFAGLMVFVAALLGALPVIRSAGKLDLHSLLQSSAQQSTTAGGGRRSLHALVIGEMALTLVIMVQAGLVLQTFRSLQKIDPGYRADHVLIYEIALPGSSYPSREARRTFYQEHFERVRSLPGVVSVSAVTAPPLGGHWGNFFTLENAPPKGANEPDPVVLQRLAFPGYFETMGIRMVAGRSFTDQDGISEGTRAVIVNETFVKRFYPGENPVGKRLRHRYPNAPWMTVVGVAGDVKHYGVDQPMIPGVYIPYAQDSQGQMSVVVRSTVAPTSLVPFIRALMRQSHPGLPIFGVVTMEERLSQSMWPRRLCASLVIPATRGLVYGISPVDPLTFLGLALLLVTVALAACWRPARRAMKINPMEALRYE